MIVISCNISKH